MCFIPKDKNNLIQTAENDIVTYKVFLRIKEKRNFFERIFKRKEKPLYTYKAPFFMNFSYGDLTGEYEDNDFGGHVCTDYFGFHSYKDKVDAIELKNWFTCNHKLEKGMRYVVCECIIPQGSEYEEGYAYEGEVPPVFVSKKIKVSKIF